jgi:hypothetical protein
MLITTKIYNIINNYNINMRNSVIFHMLIELIFEKNFSLPLK